MSYMPKKKNTVNIVLFACHMLMIRDIIIQSIYNNVIIGTYVPIIVFIFPNAYYLAP